MTADAQSACFEYLLLMRARRWSKIKPCILSRRCILLARDMHILVDYAWTYFHRMLLLVGAWDRRKFHGQEVVAGPTEIIHALLVVSLHVCNLGDCCGIQGRTLRDMDGMNLPSGVSCSTSTITGIASLQRPAETAYPRACSRTASHSSPQLRLLMLTRPVGTEFFTSACTPLKPLHCLAACSTRLISNNSC